MLTLKIIGFILYLLPVPIALFISSFIWGSSDFNLNSFQKTPLIILSCVFWPAFLSFAAARNAIFGKFNTNYLT